MIKRSVFSGGGIGLETREGTPIEVRIKRLMQGAENIEQTAPIIYTDKKDGVRPEFDIRTDSWEIKQNAMDAIHESSLRRRAGGDGTIPTDAGSEE